MDDPAGLNEVLTNRINELVFKQLLESLTYSFMYFNSQAIFMPFYDKITRILYKNRLTVFFFLNGKDRE